MSYPIDVVAEKGALQRRIGLTPINRTATANFPKGVVTIRTNNLPSPEEGGSYALYFNSNEGHRAVCHVGPAISWGDKGRVESDEIYYHFNSGSLKKTELDDFFEVVKSIEAKVDALMRKEANAHEEI